MLRVVSANLAVAAAALFIAVPLLPQQAEAQTGSRFQVMVPNFQPTDGSRDRFGNRVADRLRNDLDLPTHVGLPEREADRAARNYDMRFRDLTCLEARQLASLIEVPVVLCGEYHEEGGQFRVVATAYTVPGNEEFPIEPFLVAQNDERGAASHIMSGFEDQVQRFSYVAWCQDDFRSSNFEEALRRCTEAIRLAPDSREARYALAATLMELENYEESMEHFEIILAADAADERALESAAWVAGQLGDTERARDYYTRYLEINPGNVPVRIRVAHELAQAGDPEGAMEFVRVGLEQDPDHVGLLEQYGSYAFLAARDRQQFAPVTQDGEQTVSPEVAELYREASRALMRVVEMEGAESRPSYVVNSARAYVQLGEYEEALQVVEAGLEIFPEEASLWSEKATVHNRRGEVSDAVAALERGLQLDPDLPNARARMAHFLIQDGQVNEAIAAFERAVEAGEQTADQAARLILQHAYQNFVQNQRDVPEGIRLMERAKQFDVSSEVREQLHFFHGFSLYQRGVRIQEPQSLDSAQRSLPVFQEARRLIQQGEGHVRRTGAADYDELMNAVNTYIEIQEAIIRRGR